MRSSSSTIPNVPKQESSVCPSCEQRGRDDMDLTAFFTIGRKDVFQIGFIATGSGDAAG